MCFVRDFYRTISYKLDDWCDDLVEITGKIKETLLLIIDKLDRLKETYLEDIIDIDNIQFALDAAVLAIPELTQRKVKKRRF